jgi:hypothetical protein
MTITIKHAFTSTKGDGTDALEVQPSHWNAVHATSMSANTLIGRLTAGAGAFEEIPISAYMATLLTALDAATLAAKLGLFTTGDLKHSVNPSPPAGWILYQASLTLGAVGSSASYKGDIYYPLFCMLWTNISDTYCPVIGGRGSSFDIDWTNNKQITLPLFGGRSILSAGTTAGTTGRLLGQYGGEETHQLTVTELASHRHSMGIYDPKHAHGYTEPYDNPVGVRWFDSHNEKAIKTSFTTSEYTNIRTWAGDVSGGLFDVTYLAGGDVAHNNMQPHITMWLHIKL